MYLEFTKEMALKKWLVSIAMMNLFISIRKVIIMFWKEELVEEELINWLLRI